MPREARAPRDESLDEMTDLDLFGRAPKGRRDWSHRRGEPRGLALGWTLYLMGATVGSLMPVMSGSRMDSAVYRPAARTLLVLIVVGVCVLWPMLRAAQDRPSRIGRDVTRDLVILLIPALTLIWPQVLLADWPVEVVGAASVVVAGWALLTGVWLRVAQRFGDWGPAHRTLAVAGPVLLVAVAPGLLWLTGLMGTSSPGAGVTPGWMWTPVTSVWEIVRDRSWSGQSAWVGAGHWRWALSLLVAGALGHALAGVASQR